MRLGFAVKVLGDGGLPSHDTRRWQSGPHLRESIACVRAILAYAREHDIAMYRMASQLVPYGTHPDLPRFHGQIDECRDELAELGRDADGIRLSSHPGQYVVLNSTEERIRDAAIRDLELHGELFEAMGLPPEAVVVLHVGSGGDDGIERLERGVELLSDRARSRLVIENDDRTHALADVLPLAERTGLPVVWDVLHHHCHDPAGIPDDEALALALATWPDGVTPKIHWSSPRTVMEERVRKDGRRVIRTPAPAPLRAHADLVDPLAFEWFMRSLPPGLPEFDVMLEAKGKDLALRRLREQLGARGFGWDDGRLQVSSRARDGWTRFGSPGIFGYSGG